MSKAKQALASTLPEVKRLEKENAALRQRLDRFEAAKFSLPTGKARKGRKPKSFCRVICGDNHGEHVDQRAATAFFADVELIGPREIVHTGDLIDVGGFLAQHHTLGFVPETKATFEADVIAGNVFLDELQQRAPQATIHFIEGNHEARIEKSVIKWTEKNPQDAAFLHSMFSVSKVLHLEKRGIHHYRQGVFYQDLPLPATIKLGHCYFTHGASTAKHAAAVHLDMYGGNVVYGHTHRRDSATKRTVKEDTIGAWNPGCLCKIQRLWNMTTLTNWSHGYGLQVVQSDGKFLHINVPIIDGVSYLQPLAKEIGS